MTHMAGLAALPIVANQCVPASLDRIGSLEVIGNIHSLKALVIRGFVT